MMMKSRRPTLVQCAGHANVQLLGGSCRLYALERGPLLKSNGKTDRELLMPARW